MRIQWGGPWTKPRVPMRVRYRQTHWVALRNNNEEVFDVNATCSGGWIKTEEWEWKLVPWLIKEAVPKGDGTWWPTHVLEVLPNARVSYRRRDNQRRNYGNDQQPKQKARRRLARPRWFGTWYSPAVPRMK